MTLPQALRWHRRTRPEPLVAPPADLAEAEEFLAGYHAEHPDAGSGVARIRAVRAEIMATGTYAHTPDELAWAAKLAWRHSARCSGRDKWSRLRLRDRRGISSSAEVAAETLAHLREATNRGNIRSVITVFAPDTPRRRGPRIVNPQVLRYAGYRQSEGSLLGDPANEELTRQAQELGWQGMGSAFDLLPLIVADPSGRQVAFDIPPVDVLEVAIFHPRPGFEWFAGLGLKWYAVPLISDMYLDAGGIKYPCAPFNGWYQAGSEIGVRNFGDDERYGMLPTVAAGMGLDTSRLSTLWRDEAAVQLAVAVQASFAEAGVMATDHQSELARFMRFAAAEEDAQRPWCADWSWVNPPGCPTPAFHRTYPNPELKPCFGRDGEDAPGR